MSLFVFDDSQKDKRRNRFTLLDTQFAATPLAWLNLPLMIGMGIVLSLFFMQTGDLVGQVLIGIGYGLLIMLGSMIHGIGHIISSRMVGAPVKFVVMTMTVNYLDYGEDGEHPSRVHIGRALGGPVMNAVIGIMSLAILGFVIPNHFIAFFGGVNIALALITIAPVPSVDGAVILREMRDWKSPE